ncbi:MAG TPA: tRNA pseudouridine(38-40) synthase TruA [Candidatus Monoglobus merdigallinarum]|uniref:tRNA pseudouridine synthase A n=1 Tax=Candidatus Monoglobus merdigallinarum TaxID=2838698 RepID=A0A9D1TM99_9FIRM|nr:tRNA pseudouridine(38-40) synthase TruA [Candidatus Monoglobus merdigallinarum]
MKNIALKICYDGTNYHGWQYQQNGLTVQETIETAIKKATGEQIRVTGCSRTDAGVHALEYILNFRSGTRIPAERLPYALNFYLPNDISAQEAWEAPEDFSARFSVKGKRYIYKILNHVFKNPFLSKYSWHFPYPLDLEKINRAAAAFEGKHDFRGFMASGGQQRTTVRTVRACFAERTAPDLITVTVEADAFLYNMVRIIVGTLADAGSGKLDPDALPALIASGDRRLGGITAPPQGLFLQKVYL